MQALAPRDDVERAQGLGATAAGKPLYDNFGRTTVSLYATRNALGLHTFWRCSRDQAHHRVAAAASASSVRRLWHWRVWERGAVTALGSSLHGKTMDFDEFVPLEIERVVDRGVRGEEGC